MPDRYGEPVEPEPAEDVLSPIFDHTLGRPPRTIKEWFRHFRRQLGVEDKP